MSEEEPGLPLALLSVLVGPEVEAFARAAQ